MQQLFYPARVAVIGVSDNPLNLGRKIVENMTRFDFSGHVFPVGPRSGTVAGHAIHSSINDLPDDIDVAVIITPAPTVPGIIDQCGQKGIQWAIVESGGFGELSDAGKNLGDLLLEVAQRWGIRVVGPNGLGVTNTDNGFVTPFVDLQKEGLKKGRVALLAQSGGVMYTLINRLGAANLGVSKVVSVGNKLDLDESDYLSYLAGDPHTDVIVMYLESIRNGRRLVDIAAGTSKPIIIHKVNRYPMSMKIAQYHTDALAGDDAVVDAAFARTGILRAHSYREVIDMVKICTLPPMTGDNLVVISRSGGTAISTADLASEYGFVLYPLSERFLRRVQEKSPSKVIRRTNPLDVGDLFDLEFYAEITEDALKEETDGIFFQHGTTMKEEVDGSVLLGNTLHDLSMRYHKPVAMCFFSDEHTTRCVSHAMHHPLFDDPLDAIGALAASRDRARQRTHLEQQGPVPRRPYDASRITEILGKTVPGDETPLLSEALDLLAAAGIPIAPHLTTSSQEAACAWAREMRYPVTLKIDAPSIIHKTDIDGVAGRIDNEETLKKTFERLQRVAQTRTLAESILVQSWVDGGLEMILGAKTDESFGPVILLGFGGIYTEIIKDTAIRLLPLTEREAQTLPTSLKSAPLLKGLRGQPARDLPALADALLRLSQLMMDFPRITGVDINPLFVLPESRGLVALDARIVA